jgi:hypothetical protein
MKLHRLAALAWFAALPVFAAPAGFAINFEKAWDFDNGDVNRYYAGGTAADGTMGPNLGVSFVNVSGLSNDANFTYYSNAPTGLGVAYAHTFDPADRAFMNVVGGVGAALSFFYSTPSDVTAGVRAFTGLNGTGVLLGTFNLIANSANYDAWTQATFRFAGFASSFEFTNAANIAAFDNISALAIPEPEILLLLAMGGVAALCVRGRRRSSV